MIKQLEIRVCDQCGSDKVKCLTISLDGEKYAFPEHDFCSINCFVRYVAKNPDLFIFKD